MPAKTPTCAAEVADFLIREVATFVDVRVEGPGSAFHYTANSEAIRAAGRFVGAPINKELDRTQLNPKSPPATSDPGVVFAYDKLEDAQEEGLTCDIFRLEYTEAVSALHSQEAAASRAVGLSMPRTILIINRDITHFETV